MSFFFLTNYYYRTRPGSPNIQRTYPWNNHGHVVYLNATENYSLFLLVVAAVGCLLGAILIKGQRKARMGSPDSVENRSSKDGTTGLKQ
jgi:hypothetical protein